MPRTADPQPRVEEWYQPNPVPVNPATAPVQGISPMLGAMDPMYQQYQYQTAPQIPQMQPMQQGFSPQYQYPYYQQGQYAQYAGAAQPYGAQQLYQHQMQQAANRPPSQQAGECLGKSTLEGFPCCNQKWRPWSSFCILLFGQSQFRWLDSKVLLIRMTMKHAISPFSWTLAHSNPMRADISQTGRSPKPQYANWKKLCFQNNDSTW